MWLVEKLASFWSWPCHRLGAVQTWHCGTADNCTSVFLFRKKKDEFWTCLGAEMSLFFIPPSLQAHFFASSESGDLYGCLCAAKAPSVVLFSSELLAVKWEENALLRHESGFPPLEGLIFRGNLSSELKHSPISEVHPFPVPCGSARLLCSAHSELQSMKGTGMELSHFLCLNLNEWADKKFFWHSS